MMRGRGGVAVWSCGFGSGDGHGLCGANAISDEGDKVVSTYLPKGC